MGRWTQYDEDEYRLPPGVRRTGYDADTGEYFFSGGYKSLPYSEYGPLVPVGTTHTKPKPTTIVSEFLSPKSERASTSRLQSAKAVRGLWERYKHRERRDPVVSPTEEWESSSEEEEPSKDGKVTVTPPVTLTMLSKLHRDKPTPGGLEQTEPQFTLPIYDKFSSRSNSLSAVSRTGSNVSSSSSSRHTRSVTTPEVSRRVDGNQDGAEDRKDRTRQYRSLGVTSTSPTRKALGSHESPPSHRESSSSSMNATIGSGSRIPSFITESDLPPPPLPAKDSHSRVTSLSSSDVRESWSTEGGSLSSLPYLGVSS